MPACRFSAKKIALLADLPLVNETRGVHRLRCGGTAVVSEQGVNELSDLILTRMAELGTPGKPLTLREVSRRTRGRVSYEVVRKISRGEHSGRLQDTTIEGLAAALEVPAQTIYSIARVPRPLTRWQWPARYDRLDAAQRQIVEDVAAAMLDAYEKGLRDA
jgi:hypothetical protein